MNIFLKTLLYLVQSGALWTVFLRRKVIKKTTQHYFLHYMCFVAVIELTANLTSMYTSLEMCFTYNIYDIVSYLFFQYWFYTILKPKKLVIVLAGIYGIALFASLFIENIFQTYLEINVFAGTIMVLILVFMYYASLLQKKEVVHFLTLPAFWISTGLLIFYIGYLPILFLINIEGAYDPVYVQFVVTILNLAMYGCFIKAFLCPQTK